MKKLTLIFAALTFCSTIALKAQNNTKYGTGALNSITTGQNNSAFGVNALYYNTVGNYNTSTGTYSLFSNTTGNFNTANGYLSLFNNNSGRENSAFGAYTLYSNNSGIDNTAIGIVALYANTSGSYNTATGTGAMYANTLGNNNTGTGYDAMYLNTTGNNNTAFGANSLYHNTYGNENTAIGVNSLFNNIADKNTATGYFTLSNNSTGSCNTANGNRSLQSNTEGGWNTANGSASLYSNTTGWGNTATGAGALYSNNVGNENVATGDGALYTNNAGFKNIAIGNGAAYNNIDGDLNTVIGYDALYYNYYGNYNTAIGANSGFIALNYWNTIAIGYNTLATASYQARIGNSSITSIGGQVSWTTLSDGRFKKEIKHNVAGLDFINKLEPVSYIVDKDAFDNFLKIPDSLKIKNDNTPIVQSGFIAQDVEKVLKQMNITNFSGVDLPKNENDYYGIRYAEFVVPLVKAVQELSALDKEKDLKITSLEDKINQLEKIMLESGLVSNLNSVNQLQSELNQNNPNPFGNTTEIKCVVPSNATSAMLIVFDMNGKQIKTINISERGDCSIKINAADLKGAGMYLYSLYIDNKEISTKRMILSE